MAKKQQRTEPMSLDPTFDDLVAAARAELENVDAVEAELQTAESELQEAQQTVNERTSVVGDTNSRLMDAKNRAVQALRSVRDAIDGEIGRLNPPGPEPSIPAIGMDHLTQPVKRGGPYEAPQGSGPAGYFDPSPQSGGPIQTPEKERKVTTNFVHSSEHHIQD